jgi:hypothetical protein
MSSSEKILSNGDSIKLSSAEAEVLEVEGRRAKIIRVTIDGSTSLAAETKDPEPNKKV